MTYGTYLGKNGFNEQTGNLEKENGPYMTKRGLKEYANTSRLEATAREHLEKVYRWALHHGVHGVPGDAEISPRRITGSALISALVLGVGVGGAAAHTENTTDINSVIGNIAITIRGNVSGESPDPYECLFADDGNLSQIGPALALAAMVAKYESEKLPRVEKEAAEIINLDGEHKPPMDVSKFVNADWSEVIEWDGNLYWRDGSMGRAEEGKMYIQELTPLTDAEESYYRNIYDGPKKPRDNRIFEEKIAIK